MGVLLRALYNCLELFSKTVVKPKNSLKLDGHMNETGLPESSNATKSQTVLLIFTTLSTMLSVVILVLLSSSTRATTGVVSSRSSTTAAIVDCSLVDSDFWNCSFFFNLRQSFLR